MVTATDPPTVVTAEAFAERLFSACLGAMETMSVYLGDRLGWYRSLVDDGPATSQELAERTATNERYAREWLDQQAVIGILTVVSPSGDARATGGDTERRYAMPTGAAEVLTDANSLVYLGPLPRMMAAVGPNLPALLESYRRGGGVSWEQLGDDARISQADLNRPWFEHKLGDALRSVDEVRSRLSQPQAKILDVGCGAGWSTIALARAYPSAQVDGVDIDSPSVDMAWRNAAAAGVSTRVRFCVADGGSLATDASYDAAFAFECIHDLPRPVAVLDAVRRSVQPDGLVVVMDEAVADAFTAPGDDLERLMYGYSVLVCLPDGMSSAPSVGTGTVMRLDTLRQYARQAGFADVDVLPIEEFGFWRFYRLRM